MNEFLEKIKGNSNLRNSVLNYYIENNYENSDELFEEMKKIKTYNCNSKKVKGMIYYDDTNDFYDNNKQEINELLGKTIIEKNTTVEELFGDEYEKEDPLILGYKNKNLLAWFGFQSMSNNLLEEVKEKIKNNNLEINY